MQTPNAIELYNENVQLATFRNHFDFRSKSLNNDSGLIMNHFTFLPKINSISMLTLCHNRHKYRIKVLTISTTLVSTNGENTLGYGVLTRMFT